MLPNWLLYLQFFLCFSVNIVEDKSSEDTNDTKPLAGDERISKQEDRSKNGKELSRGGDDGACQRSEVSYGHEDEILQWNKKKVWVSKRILQNNFSFFNPLKHIYDGFGQVSSFNNWTKLLIFLSCTLQHLNDFLRVRRDIPRDWEVLCYTVITISNL